MQRTELALCDDDTNVSRSRGRDDQPGLFSLRLHPDASRPSCSDTYRIARLHLDDLQLAEGYSLAKAYGQSKLAILYFTLELASRLSGTEITVNAVDPGPVASNIGADNPGLAYRLMSPLIRNLFPSPARAARTALMVAMDLNLADVSGGYYRSRKRRDNPLDFDPESSRRLWQASLELCGFDPDPLA